MPCNLSAYHTLWLEAAVLSPSACVQLASQECNLDNAIVSRCLDSKCYCYTLEDGFEKTGAYFPGAHMREAERSLKLRRELRQASEMPQYAAVSSMPTLCLSSLHNPHLPTHIEDSLSRYPGCQALLIPL